MSQLLNTIRQIATVMQKCVPLEAGLLYANPALSTLTKNTVQVRSVLVKCLEAPKDAKLRLIVVPAGQTLEGRMEAKVKRDQEIAKYPERFDAYEQARAEFDEKKEAGDLTENELAKPPVRPTEPSPLRIDLVVGGIDLKTDSAELPQSCISGAPAFSPGDALYAVFEGVSAGTPGKPAVEAVEAKPAVEAKKAVKDGKGKIVEPAVAAQPEIKAVAAVPEVPAVPADVVSGLIALDFVPSV